MPETFFMHNAIEPTAVVQTASALGEPCRTNHGLRFTKYFGGWEPNSAELKPQALLDWLNPFNPNRQKGRNEILFAGDKVLIEEALSRHRAMTEAMGGFSFKLRAVSRVLTGVGLPHPSQNGFAFDHLLGVPVLEGSALKAIARRWATEETEDDIKPEVIAKALGAGHGSDHEGGGDVSILRALPVGQVRLTAEQITRHYEGYYEGPNPALGRQRTDLEIPATWYEPVPITRLAMDASWDKPQCFEFFVLPLKKGADVIAVAEWVKEAVMLFGFGASTDTFGHFDVMP